MKRLLLAYLIILITASCTHKEIFKVEGKVSDVTFEGSKVYLVALDGPISKNVDSTIVTGGSFFFEKKADSLCVKILRVPVRYPNFIEDLVVVLEPGNLNVVLSSNSHGEGTRLNNILQEWKEKKRGNDSLQNQLYKQINNTGTGQDAADSLRKYSQQLTGIYRSYVMNLMNNNLHNGIGFLLFKVYYHDLPAEEKLRILDLTGSKYPENDGQLKLMIKNDPDIKR